MTAGTRAWPVATPRGPAVAGLLVAVVIWGWTFVATKVALRSLDPLALMALRFLIALPALAAVARWRRVPLRSKGPWGVLLLGSAVFTLHFLVQIAGLRSTTAVNTGWIIAITPLVLALLAWLLLGERLRPRARLALWVATAGILLLVSGGDPRNLVGRGATGDWLVLASAHTWALYTLAMRRAAAHNDPLTLTWIATLPAALVPLGARLLQGEPWGLAAMPLGGWGALLFLGVAGSALAQWLWQVGVARLGASEAGLFLYLEPLATTSLAVVWLAEPLPPATIAGGLLALGAVAWAQRSPRRLGPGPAAGVTGRRVSSGP